MALPDPITWPIAATGIATKNAPFMLSAGGQLVLDNVRQERKDEWRTRSGFTHDALDDLPGANVPVIATEAPWGGMVGLCRKTDAETAGLVYNPTSAPRWTTPLLTFLPNSGGQAQQCSQVNPGVWSRQTIAPSTGGAIQQCGLAEGGGYRLSAWWSNIAGNGIQMALTTTAGAVITASSQWGNFPNIIRPRCVYSSAANMLIMVYASSVGGVVSAVRFSTLTGLQVGGTSTLSTNGHVGLGMFLDAIYYGGNTITIAFRDNTGADALRIIEYNPATDVGTEYIPGINCQNTLSLLPDPDVSGIRMVAVCTLTPEVRVLRLNAVGVIQTNHLAEAVATAAISGVAYGAGVNWMIVYNGGVGLGPRAIKRRNGTTTSAPAQLGSAATINGGMFLMSNGWREPGTDPMHYMLLIGDADFSQPTYLEMALDYDNASATVVNRWTEPQSRLVPLNAQYLPFDQPIQVQRTGTDRFVTCLPRLTVFDLPADLGGSSYTRYVIDAWTVQYMNGTTYTGQNQGQGCQTQQCAYLPVGSLLQTATGQLLCSHGASSLPFIPLAVQSTGGGTLGLTKRYSCVVTTTLYDELGNAWESEPSTAKAITLTGANNQITWTATNTPFENAARQRTVKFWRTAGNGAAYFLLHEVTDTIANTVNIAYLDQIDDSLLSQTISAEVQAAVTPALSHIIEWNGRLWGVERDFPTRVLFSKPLSNSSSPVFPTEFVVDTDDGFGPITGLAAMDDKIVVTKARAVYVGGGDGPDNAGNGSFPTFNRVSSETGKIVGAPIVSTGREVYLVGLGGLFRLQGGQQIDFVGAAIDRYLSMPLLESQETVTGMVLSAGANEVRIQTNSYRFVHDRIFNLWIRDTGGMVASSGIVMTKMLGGTQQCMFTAAGQLWREAADTVTPSDAGIAYAGTVRTAWIRPNGVEGWLRVYRARVLGECTVAGSVAQPTLTIFYDSDDTVFESFQPIVSISATKGPIRAEGQPRRIKCGSFSLQLTLPVGDASVRLDAWSATAIVLPGAQPLSLTQKWLHSGTGIPICPPCPPVPTPGPTPLVLAPPIVAKVHNNIVDTQGGPNQRDLLVKVKNALIASGKWTVVSSSDGATVSPTDLWTDWTKVLGFPFGVSSWIVLRGVVRGWEIRLSAPITIGWTEVTFSYSPSGSYAGGSTTVLPTAADNLDICGNSWLGRFPAASPTYYAIVWNAADGSNMRVGWFYLGHMIAWWQIDSLYMSGSPNTSSWTNPSMGAACRVIFDPATDWQKLTANKFSFSGLGANDFEKAAWVPPGVLSDLLYGSTERVLNASSNAYPSATVGAAPNPWNSKYMWVSPMGMHSSGGGSPTNFLGYLQDQWWTTPNFNDGDTIDGGKYIIVGESILPYDGTLAPPIGGGVSVDYPKTSFYGRTTL